jgi:hypothetical protein
MLPHTTMTALTRQDATNGHVERFPVPPVGSVA